MLPHHASFNIPDKTLRHFPPGELRPRCPGQCWEVRGLIVPVGDYAGEKDLTDLTVLTDLTEMATM